MVYHKDGFYEFNEEFIAVNFAHQMACGKQPPGQCSDFGIQRMWQRWQARRTHPIYSYGGHPLLSLWSAYVVRRATLLSHHLVSHLRKLTRNVSCAARFIYRII